MESTEDPPSKIMLENFVNFDEVHERTEEIDDEQKQENFEMTE